MAFRDNRGAIHPPQIGKEHLQVDDVGAAPSSARPQGGDNELASARLEAGEFLKRVEIRVGAKRKRGALAYIEIQNPYTSGDSDSADAADVPSNLLYSELSKLIGKSICQDDVFCWHDGRFILLLTGPATAHQTLTCLESTIATVVHYHEGSSAYLTPVVGYVDLRNASTAEELWRMANTALDCAKSSLEIEPFRYVRKFDVEVGTKSLGHSLGLNKKIPQWLTLSFQLIASLVLGLGAPFILYAVCDALGVDISGPVYIGVVIVLVITATTIWIEGFLALRPTAPPKEPSSAYPPATIIIPAYLPNEADTIVETLNAFLRLDYPNSVQVLIAYNSPVSLPVENELQAIAASQPKDGRFVIEPVRVAGSTSKAQNVNAVIGRVRGKFVGIFDADHHPRPESLRRAWRWLSNGWDIVQGRCSIRNGADSWVSRMVAIEFQQIYSVSHPGRARFHGFGIFGGSNGFWRTSVLHETRMRQSMLTEDIDSSIRAVKAGYRIAGDRDLVSEELAPTSLNQLLNQRLRWAQGWFQVSLRRIVPVLLSPQVTTQQKLGLIHLLIWRELFPWYSIQVVPILTYWVWAYGWHYIQWTVPVFVATTIYTLSTGPGQILFAYLLAEKSMRRKASWFVEYFIVSTLFYSPFKDTISRIAHIKEAMRERAWKVTPRASAPRLPTHLAAKATLVCLLMIVVSNSAGVAQTVRPAKQNKFSKEYIRVLMGGEVSSINSARPAAQEGRNGTAAKLFEQAIHAVPRRRSELLKEYADALNYSDQSAKAVTLYMELLSSSDLASNEKLQIRKSLALALTWSGQHGAALKVYENILAAAPADADAAVRRARGLAWLGRQNDAVVYLSQVPSKNWADGTLGMLGDEILIEAARKAAAEGQYEAAVHLLDRAMRHNPSLRPSLLREYADQLVLAKQISVAIPSYREVVADRRVSAEGRLEAQLGLARALQTSGQPKEAYKTYFSALERDPTPSPDQLMTAATMAVAAGQNGDLGKIVKNVVAACTECSGEIIRGYADQINFMSRARESLPLYRLALTRISPRTESYRKAQRGLSLGLTWSNAHAEALDAWTTYLRSVPGDSDALVHKAQVFSTLSQNEKALQAYQAAYAMDRSNIAAKRGMVSETIYLARAAAQADRNADAAALFATAMEMDSEKRVELLREYADQLNYGGRSADAVPFYVEVLGGSTLSPLDRKRAMVGLADAYAWSGKLDQAVVSYTGAELSFPDDVKLQWVKLVTAARLAAQTNRNKDAGDLFAKAIKLGDDRNQTILREYADQLCFTGQSLSAISLYLKVLKQPELTEADRWATKKGLAQAYNWSGQFDEAKSAYNELIGKYPEETSLKWELLVISARVAGEEDRNKEAASMFAEAIKLLPVRRASVLKEYADKLTFSGNSKAAIPLYKELIAQATKPTESRKIELALAQALAWDSQLESSLQEYRRLAGQDPRDIEAANGVARLLSWTDNQSEAKEAYERVLDMSPGNPTAQRGLAQVEDWLGHHRAAQAILAQRLDADPSDLEAHRLLAQSQMWMGRPDKAMAELNLAMGKLQAAAASRGLKNQPEVRQAENVGQPPAELAAQMRGNLRLVNIQSDNRP